MRASDLPTTGESFRVEGFARTYSQQYVCIIVRYKLSIRGAYKEVRRVSGLEVKLKKLKFREFRNRSLENSEIEVRN